MCKTPNPVSPCVWHHWQWIRYHNNGWWIVQKGTCRSQTKRREISRPQTGLWQVTIHSWWQYEPWYDKTMKAPGYLKMDDHDQLLLSEVGANNWASSPVLFFLASLSACFRVSTSSSDSSSPVSISFSAPCTDTSGSGSNFRNTPLASAGRDTLGLPWPHVAWWLEHLGVCGPISASFPLIIWWISFDKAMVGSSNVRAICSTWPPVSHFKFSGSGWSLGASLMYCWSPPFAILCCTGQVLGAPWFFCQVSAVPPL